jgi:molecular chaperone DnaK (HSP70)
MTLDQWLYEEVLRQNRRDPSDEMVRRLSRTLLVECEAAKARLSEHDRATVCARDPDTGLELAAEVTRRRFEEILDRHEMFTQIENTLRRALNDARERGYEEEDVKSVLMVGGSSLVPSVQQALQRRFGRDRVQLNRPLDAVARGAAAFVAGVDFYDHIQHDYAIRSVNFQKGDYEYRRIVRRGTPYPTREPVARVTLRATHDGQAKLGLAIFELGERRQRDAGPAVELVFDPSGAARVLDVTPDEEDRRSYFWVNEQSPTFLSADPPAKHGEPRFEVEFGIDGNKRLLVTARDLKTGRVTHRNHPVVKLV